MTTETLLPCPFCGSSWVGFKTHGLPDTQCGCNNCGAAGHWHKNRAEAIAAWNTRASAAREAELVEALEKAEDALRSYACEGAGAPCLRTAEQCRADCGRPASQALDAAIAALARRRAEGGAP